MSQVYDDDTPVRYRYTMTLRPFDAHSMPRPVRDLLVSLSHNSHRDYPFGTFDTAEKLDGEVVSQLSLVFVGVYERQRADDVLGSARMERVGAGYSVRPPEGHPLGARSFQRKQDAQEYAGVLNRHLVELKRETEDATP